ncbi:MAG: ASCH domain-containing protein, partial [Bacilli bacterium]
MKVLSIRQPWASLIINGYKEYELRSWNTHYRGDVLIHACKNIDKKQANRFSSLNLDYPTGKIIGKVNITNCIKVTKDFERELVKKNNLVYDQNPYRSGYAFKLEDVTKFKKEILASGQLGFWNYYKPEEILEMMNDIEYGWMDKNKKKQYNINDKFSSLYLLASPKETINNKVGVCFDQTEVERFYFKNSGYVFKTYFIIYYSQKVCPSHTFLVYEEDNNYYWFEHAWKEYIGIHKYSNIDDLLIDVRQKFSSKELNKNFNINNLVIREYSKPKYGISVDEFFRHCEKCLKIM